MYKIVEEFAYVTYNHVRPHSYNSYRTPYQARMAVQGEARARLLIGLHDCPKSEVAGFVNGMAVQHH